MRRNSRSTPSDEVSAVVRDRPLACGSQSNIEQDFQALVESLPDAILVHRQGFIAFVNPSCVQLIGAPDPDILLGKNISEFVDPVYLPTSQSRPADCSSTGSMPPSAESVSITWDGSSIPIETVSKAISWNGAPAIEVVLRDIRRRKQAEQEAQEWQKRLELAQAAGLRIGLWDWRLGKQHRDLVRRDLPTIRILS